jgi:hypothetical protein
MISRLCAKLEAAMAPGDWPSFTQPPDASGKAAEGAYRMLDAELHTGAAKAPQVLPPNCSLGPPQSSYVWTAADAPVHHSMHRLSGHSFTGSNSCRSPAVRLCIAGVYCVDALFYSVLLSVGILHASRRSQLAMPRACSACAV